MIKKILFISGIILFSMISDAQINNIHNFQAQNLFFYSPAHTGDREQLAAFVDYRRHLFEVENSTELAFVGLHSPITKQMSLGGLIQTQKVGLFKTISGRLDYSFKTKISENQKIAFGINVGMMQRGLDYSSATVFDPTDPTLIDNGYIQKNIFFSGASIAYNYKNFELDLGVPKIYQTKEVTNVFHANYWTFLAYSIYTKDNKFQLKPSVSLMYNSQNLLAYNVNFMVNYDNLIWVQPTYKVNGSIAFSVGVNYKKMGFSYSYETNSQALNSIGGASHEIMLTYGFLKAKPKIDTTTEYSNNLKQKIGDKTYEEYVTSNNYGFYNNIIGLTDSIHKAELKRIAKLKKENLDSINQAKLLAIEKTKRDSARAHNLRHLSKEELSVLKKGVHFQLGSSVLNNEERIYLNKVAKLIKKNNNIKILISGHTCDIGSDKTNFKFSKDRAETVMFYLKNRGVKTNKISVDFKLDAEPIAPNTDEENRSQNRRVSFSVIKE